MGVSLIALSVVGVINMNSINNGTTTVYQNGVIPVQQLGDIDAMMKQIRGDVYHYILVSDGRDALEQSINTEEKSVTDGIAAYSASTPGRIGGDVILPKNKQTWLAMKTNWTTYQSEVVKILTAVKEGRQNNAMNLIADGSPVVLARTAIVSAATDLANLQSTEVKKINTDSQNTFTRSSLILICLSDRCLSCVINHRIHLNPHHHNAHQ